jgi:peptidoglycan/xylan/chitin deacetylase (PgdA/CDA1 family)
MLTSRGDRAAATLARTGERMPDHTRTEARLRRRQAAKRRDRTLAAGIIVFLALALGTGAFAVLRLRTPKTAVAGLGAAATSAPSTLSPIAGSQDTSPDVTPPSAVDSASPVASQDASAALTAREKAAQSSKSAVSRAAVAYPGAPAISPVTPSVSQLKPRHKYIAFTLDDGYNFQPRFLKLFQKYDAHCTTFLIGAWAASHKRDVKLMSKAGFEIGNHTWNHAFLTKLSSSQIQSQLRRTQRVISSVTGNQVPYLRPPYGDTDPHVKAAAAALGYRIILWDRTFGDSGGHPTAARVTRTVLRNGGIQPGDVILCHWGSEGSYEALKKLLPQLKAQGFKFVTVSELIADSAPRK